MEESELEEERRLAYVGITRAEEALYLTNAFSRTLYGRTQYNRPSLCRRNRSGVTGNRRHASYA